MPGLSWSIASQGAGWNGSCAIAAGKLTCGPVTVPAGTTQAALDVHGAHHLADHGRDRRRLPGDTGVVNNTGSVTTTNDGSDQSSASTCVQALVDLAITKSGSPATQVVGTGNITWTMVVTNNGPSTATGVKISDPMPAGNTYRVLDDDAGNLHGWRDPELRHRHDGCRRHGHDHSGHHAELGRHPDQHRAVVSGDRPETNVANNTATATVQITDVIMPPPCVAVSRSPRSQLFVGRKTTLTIHLNQGAKAAAGIRVRIKGAGINVVTKRLQRQGRRQAAS